MYDYYSVLRHHTRFVTSQIMYLINLGSYRSCNRLLLRLLRVTVLPLRTLDALTDFLQTRKFTVGTIGAWDGVGIL